MPKVLVRFKIPEDWNWREETYQLTRVPAVDEYITVGPVEERICKVKLVIHSPSNAARHEAEVYGDYVNREEAIKSVTTSPV